MVFGLNFSASKKKLVNEVVTTAMNKTLASLESTTETGAYSEARVEFLIMVYMLVAMEF